MIEPIEFSGVVSDLRNLDSVMLGFSLLFVICQCRTKYADMQVCNHAPTGTQHHLWLLDRAAGTLNGQDGVPMRSHSRYC